MSVSASVSITGDQAEAGRFSLMELRRLHQILVQNKNVSETNQDLVVEVYWQSLTIFRSTVCKPKYFD